MKALLNVLANIVNKFWIPRGTDLSLHFHLFWGSSNFICPLAKKKKKNVGKVGNDSLSGLCFTFGRVVVCRQGLKHSYVIKDTHCIVALFWFLLLFDFIFFFFFFKQIGITSRSCLWNLEHWILPEPCVLNFIISRVAQICCYHFL